MAKLLLIIFTLLATTFALNLDCKYNRNTNWRILGQIYACSSYQMAYDFDFSPDIVTYTGTHISPSSSSDVLMVFINNQQSPAKITSVPSNLLNFFPNLAGIHLISVRVKNIIGDELVSYSELRYFALINTDLAAIPSKFFKFNPKIAFVNFAGNQILQVGETLLSRLQNLEFVYFDYNKCVDAQAVTIEGVAGLIQELRQKCPKNDFDEEVTTGVPNIIPTGVTSEATTEVTTEAPTEVTSEDPTEATTKKESKESGESSEETSSVSEESKEKDSKEKAEKEAKEKEAKEKAEKEAKEKAEKEAKNKDAKNKEAKGKK